MNSFLKGLPPLRSGDPRMGKLSQRKIPQPSDDVCSAFFVFSLMRINSQRFKTKNAVPYGRHFSLAESGDYEPTLANVYFTSVLCSFCKLGYQLATQ